MERYIPVAQTHPGRLAFDYCSCNSMIQKSGIGDNNFGPADRNDQTDQRGPPSKEVPNTPVGPNRNGPFDQSNQTFANFGLNGKRPVFPEVSALGPVQTPKV